MTMRKLWSMVLAFAMIAALAIVPADAGLYWFQVKDEHGRPLTSGYTVQVYTSASKTHDVVFTDTGYRTQKTNPMNPDSKGVVRFATTDSTVDMVVWGHGGLAKGSVARITGAVDTDHTIVLQTQNPIKHLRLFWDSALSKGAEKDTGVDLPTGALVEDIWIEVATAAAKASVSVGLLSTEASGDADGFCKSQGADFAAAPGQWFQCGASKSRFGGLNGKGGNEGFYFTSNTRGVLLASFTAGQSTQIGANREASEGQYAEYKHLVMEGAAKSIVYLTTDRTSAGYLHIFYRELKNR